jgi:hypothetical protein
VKALDLSPIRFPDQATRVYQRAEAYRRLTPDQRLLAILDVIESGVALLEHSPHKEAGHLMRQAQEAEWRRAMKELFARHGC